MSPPTDDLSKLWRWFSRVQCRGYSPLYERIAGTVAADEPLLARVLDTPPHAHLPLGLLGAVHYLLLEEPELPLAAVYAGRRGDDPGPLFADFCRERWDEIAEVMSTRRVQTNECGRSALIGPALTWIAARVRQPLALVDVGASAGLNLLCDRYRLDYGAHGSTGPAASPVHVSCSVVGGSPPIADRLPPLAARVGIDRTPVDVADPDAARWLLACTWPDTGRMDRTSAAVLLARSDPPGVVAGDAIEALPAVVRRLPQDAAVVVMTTWAFAYFSPEQRRRFVAVMAAESAGRPLVWLSAEDAGTVDELAREAAPVHELTKGSLGLVWFSGGEEGERRARLLAFVHEHGAFIHWRVPPGDG